MIAKTEAIALRVAGFSRTSNIVTWLTADHGCVATLVKGAHRPRSGFLGQYDLFYTCELLFYERSRSGLHIIRECSPLDYRSAFRSDWRAACAASYMADLVERVTVDGERQPALYRLITASLDFMCAGSARPELLLWWELRLLSEIGLAPRLDRCAGCRGEVPSSQSSVFDLARGGIVCGRCVHDAGARRTLRPDVLAILRRWQAADAPPAAIKVKCSRRQLLEIYRFLGMFMGYHLDTKPTARKIAFRMLTRKMPAGKNTEH